MNAKQYIDAAEAILSRRLTNTEMRKLARLYAANVSLSDAVLTFRGLQP